ncbi:MAG: hypothetical protein ACLFVH_14035 [Phycisphaerae bacterium]
MPKSLSRDRSCHGCVVDSRQISLNAGLCGCEGWLCLLGAAAMRFSWIVVNYLLAGLHSCA